MKGSDMLLDPKRFTSLSVFATSLVLGGCVGDPANVGVTAGEDTGGTAATDTGALEGAGPSGSDTGGGDDTASTGTAPTDDDDAGDGGTSSGSDGTEIDCPDPDLTTCAQATRGLIDTTQQAVDALRDRFEGGRTVLAAELGVPGEDSPAALSIALDAAAGGGMSFSGDGTCGDSLAGAREFWTACHGRATEAGFGCQGICAIDEATIPSCIVEGKVSCVGEAACDGECAGACTLPAPSSCDGICIGGCSAACDCIAEPLGLCVGTCEGQCDGQCVFETPSACASCLGPCLYDVAPSAEQCPVEDIQGCVDGGAGACTVDCIGVPTPPVGTDACCSDLVGLAGELSADCDAPTLSLGGPAACGVQTPKGLEGIEVALGEVVVAQLRSERYEVIVAPLVAAMASLPPGVDPDACEAELWNADRDALNDILAELGELRVEIDALVDALSA